MNADELDQLPVAWSPPAERFGASPAGRFAARHGVADFAALAQRAAAAQVRYQAAWSSVYIRAS